MSQAMDHSTLSRSSRSRHRGSRGHWSDFLCPWVIYFHPPHDLIFLRLPPPSCLTSVFPLISTHLSSVKSDNKSVAPEQLLLLASLTDKVRVLTVQKFSFLRVLVITRDTGSTIVL
jgi:hypothetical protein